MKVAFAILFSLFSFSSFCQETDEQYRVSGTVYDAQTYLPLRYITATVQDIKTKEIISIITSETGEFELEVPGGKYYFTTSSLSFNPFIIQVLKIQQDLDLGTIELTQLFEELNEVEIVAKNKLVDYKSDRKVYHASKDIANVGGNAITVLENTPSVRIDEDGNITVRGNSAKVLVNGKPYGGRESNADVLSLIPANSIQKVEIITRSAKFDAEGGNILNIVLKKGTQEGYNGSVEAHGGIPNNYGGSTFINYKTEKINLFSTASFNHKLRIKNSSIEQVYLDDNNIPFANLDNSRLDNKQRNGLFLNFGSDFYLNKKNTLTTSLLYSSADKNYDSNMHINDYEPVDELKRISNRYVKDNFDEGFFEGYANLVTEFNEKGHQISILINYDKDNSINNTNILDKEIFPGEDGYNQKSNHDQNLDNYYINIDYTLPLKKGLLLELGHKSNFRIYDNDFIVTNQNPITLLYEPVNGFQNKIIYNEKIFAFWANINKEFEYLSYSIGLRSEITTTEIKDENNNENIENNYTDFFPSALLNYSFKNESSISASYNRYISRPTIKELNPFNTFTNDRFILVGNPYLDPYYSSSFSLEYHRDIENLSLNLALYHTKSVDQIGQIIEKTGFQTPNDNDIFRRIPRNNGDYSVTEFEMQLTYSPTKNIRLFGLINPYYTVLTDTKDGLYDKNDFVWIGRFTGLLRFTENFRLQISYNYQSPIATAITKFDTYQYTTLAMNKDLFDGKATLSLTINDLFNSKEFKYTSLEANTISKLNFTYDTQYLLSFTYRFNHKNKQNINNRIKDTDKNIFEIDD